MLRELIRGERFLRSKTTVRPVPARTKRVEGEFPPIIDNRKHLRVVRDLDAIEESDDSNPRNYKPHQAGGRKVREGRNSWTGISGNPIPHKSARDLNKREPSRGLIPEFNPATDVNIPSASDGMRSEQLHRLANPFLSGNDRRQGGPLYYSKYFVDRDRRLDETSVREEVLKQNDSLAKDRRKRDLHVSPTDENRVASRKRAVWKNYRPITVHEIDKVESFDKISKILSNEIHLVNEGSERKDVICALEKRFEQLLSLNASSQRPELVAVVKIIYHFGIYQRFDPIVLNKSLDLVNTQIRRLKPENVVYLLEALARLKFRDQRCLTYMDSLSLCWPLVAKSQNLLIRAANAVARLDLSSSCQTSCVGLKAVLGEHIPKLTKKQLEKIKAVTLIDKHIFDDVMLLDYFVLCQSSDMEYSRHLLLAFVKIKANRSDLVAKLPGITRDWLENLADKESRRRQTQHSLADQEDQFSSDLHRDIFRIGRICPNIAEDIINTTLCGPLSFDLFIPRTNTVIDACSDFQFYQRTAKFTADARLRHSLIRELGFRLLPITHFQWNSLKNDNEKVRWLTSQLDINR